MSFEAKRPSPALDSPTASPADLKAELHMAVEQIGQQAHRLSERFNALMARVERIRQDQADANTTFDGIEKMLGSLPQFQRPEDAAERVPSDGVATFQSVWIGRG